MDVCDVDFVDWCYVVVELDFVDELWYGWLVKVEMVSDLLLSWYEYDFLWEFVSREKMWVWVFVYGDV